MKKRGKNGKKVQKRKGGKAWKEGLEMERRANNGNKGQKWKGGLRMERRARNGKKGETCKEGLDMERRAKEETQIILHKQLVVFT